MFNIPKINQDPCSVLPRIKKRNNKSKKINLDGKEAELKATTDSKVSHTSLCFHVNKKIG